MSKNLYLLGALLIVVIAAGAFALNMTGNVVNPPTNNPPDNSPPPQIMVSVISAPAAAEEGRPFQVTWDVDGQGTATHTAIHYDTVSHPGSIPETSGPADVGYAFLTPDYASGSFALPDTFTSTITIDEPGTYYYRAHAIVDGRNIWTNERSITITAMPGSQTQTYMVDISNFAYDPPTLTINAGDTVIWTNLDGVGHTVTSDSGSELDSELLSRNENYSHTFTEAGTYNYHCRPHPYMQAKIIVE